MTTHPCWREDPRRQELAADCQHFDCLAEKFDQPANIIADSMAAMEPVERYLLFRRSGHPPPSLRELGKQFGVTPETVRQIEARALRKLDRIIKTREVMFAVGKEQKPAAKIDELNLSVRSVSCLKYNDINHVGDLVQKTGAELLRAPNFGRKPLAEIELLLARMGLRLSHAP